MGAYWAPICYFVQVDLSSTSRRTVCEFFETANALPRAARLQAKREASVKEHEVTSLRAALQRAGAGPVFDPGTPGYAAECQGFNLSVVHRPDLVVAPTTSAEVAAALRTATSAGIPLAVTGAGHGDSPPIDNGVLLTTRRLGGATLDMDNHAVTVGPATNWQTVLDLATPHG